MAINGTTVPGAPCIMPLGDAWSSVITASVWCIENPKQQTSKVSAVYKECPRQQTSKVSAVYKECPRQQTSKVTAVYKECPRQQISSLCYVQFQLLTRETTSFCQCKLSCLKHCVMIARSGIYELCCIFTQILSLPVILFI